MIGCGSANLFAALYLMNKGFNPKDIVIIDAGGDVRGRTSVTEGFAGAGLKSDGKMVFSMFPDPLSKHMTDEEKQGYHKIIKDIMCQYVDFGKIGISSPVSNEKVNQCVCASQEWNEDLNVLDSAGMSLRQSTVWHIGTDNEYDMACNMEDYMKAAGVNFYFNTRVETVDFDQKMVYCGDTAFHYDHLQIGAGKVGVKFVKKLVEKHSINIFHGFANVGGRFETSMNSAIHKFVEEVQYDYKFYKEYSSDRMGIRTFCTNNYSAYVIQEQIDGVRTYNGHAYGKEHEKANNMTNFGVMCRIHDVDAQKLHEKVLSKYGTKGCVIRGKEWDGKTSLSNSATPEITWIDLLEMYVDVELGVQIVDNMYDFICTVSKILGIGENYSLYLPEIKMAAGVIDTDREYKLSDGRFPDVSWVGDSCTGSVGIVPSAMTGIRAAEYLINHGRGK